MTTGFSIRSSGWAATLAPMPRKECPSIPSSVRIVTKASSPTWFGLPVGSNGPRPK